MNPRDHSKWEEEVWEPPRFFEVEKEKKWKKSKQNAKNKENLLTFPEKNNLKRIKWKSILMSDSFQLWFWSGQRMVWRTRHNRKKKKNIMNMKKSNTRLDLTSKTLKGQPAKRLYVQVPLLCPSNMKRIYIFFTNAIILEKNMIL